MDNRFNGIFLSFTSLHPKLSSSHRIIDNFSDYLVFNVHSKQKNNKACAYQLDNIVIETSSSSSTTIIVTNASIKNDVSTLILYRHIHNNLIAKTVHHMVHVTSTEAELFTIRYSINQASNHNDTSKIIIVTGFIHVARKIFDLFLYSFQVHSVAILTECCGNHLSQRQMITQAVNLLSWILSRNFTRELDKESLLN